MSLLDDIEKRKGFYYQTSYDPEDADSKFVFPVNTAEMNLLLAAARFAELAGGVYSLDLEDSVAYKALLPLFSDA